MRLGFSVAALLFSAASLPAATSLRPADIFTDHMVLQRDQKIPVWGNAPAGAEVTVTLADRSAKVTAGANGNWKAELSPLPAGGPHKLAVRTTETVTLDDVMVGDVWICSGQSNMEWSVAGSKGGAEEVAAASHPEIRLLTVEKNIAFQPQHTFAKPVFGGKTSWVRCSPETVGDFSGVGYFFGRAIQQSEKVPVGLIDNSWGGMPAEAFTSADTLSTLPDYKTYLANADWRTSNAAAMKQEYEDAMRRWHADLSKLDPGSAEPGWQSAELNASDWAAMTLPGYWEKSTPLKSHDGSVWFRKEVTLPENWSGNDLELSLGQIDDEDETWFNGQKVGESQYYFVQRAYKVPGSLVKSGRNVIAVRVLDTSGSGGFVPENSTMTLALKGSPETAPIPLAGEWKYKAGMELSKGPRRPQDPLNPAVPTVLYNGMVSPLVPYAIKGVVWYQGEANAGRAYQYRTLFPAMIRDWRSKWNQGDFAFLFVQLANFRIEIFGGKADDWPELREAQTETLSLPNTGMAVTIDVGDPEDIHPRDKKTVGERLALAARKVAYGEKVACSGPFYRKGSFSAAGGKATVAFDHAEGGLKCSGTNGLSGFTIAGKDQKFVPAKAEIQGETVVVSSPEVPEPAAVRYGWASSPVCNLYNQSGLPASPFRTDDWGWTTKK